MFLPENLLREARRDEGTSYHYLPPDRSAQILPRLRDKLSVAQTPLWFEAKSWTTDAPYQETTAAIETMRDDGVTYVEMALSLWNSFSELASRELAVVKCAVDELFGGESAENEGLGYKQLQERIPTGNAILLDVRPAEESAAGHLPGALSISLEELRRRVGELPEGSPPFANRSMIVRKRPSSSAT